MPYYFLGISILLAAIIIFTGLIITRDSGPDDVYVGEENMAAVSQAPKATTTIDWLEETPAAEPEPAVIKEVTKPPEPAKPTAPLVKPPVVASVATATTKKFLTLPNGSVVEVDESGNVIGSTGAAQTSGSSANIVLPSGTVLDSSGNVLSRVPGDTKQYILLPSGTVIDSAGNVILAARSATAAVATSTATTTSQTSGTPAPGSTVQIPRSVVIAVGYNPDLSCQELGFSGNNLALCDLYKNHYSQYSWSVVD